MHFVNPASNSFGNGIFDGYSIVTGHEYAEAVTDPDNIASWQDGWLDASGSENGDKCAWASNTQNITLASHQYAVQPLWSNAAFDSTESPSCGEPKSEPSDMLMTSTWSDVLPSPFGSSARSIAAPMRSVLPVQPKTL